MAVNPQAWAHCVRCGEPQAWVHCVRCGEREMMRRSALYRHSVPRCRACGGALELSDDARNDLCRSEARRDLPIEVRNKQHLPAKARRPCGARLSR